MSLLNRTDSTSGKTFASGAGGMRCQRLATVATLIVWALAQSRGDGHRSPERVFSEV